MEYRLELEHRGGRVDVVCDPANPFRAPGPFGDKSVVQWPEYRAPAWLNHDGERIGATTRIAVRSRALKTAFDIQLWSSTAAGRSRAVPLLVVHDGPDYRSYAALTRLLSCAVERGRLPPMRAALLPAVDRNRSYSASGAYAYALANEILPRLAAVAPTPPGRNFRIGMGASLGALAMMHAHRSYPESFGALFLQSGSFFVPELDAQESRFARWGPITRFVERLLNGPAPTTPIPVAMTCGTAEENLGNNRVMAEALARQGYGCSLSEHRDAHNWISWRDALDPPLLALAAVVWA
jgi:enterochelin esterase-like enzyme